MAKDMVFLACLLIMAMGILSGVLGIQAEIAQDTAIRRKTACVFIEEQTACRQTACSLQLKDRHVRLRTLKEDEDPLIIETIPSDDEWIVGDVQSDANTNENLNNSEGEKIERSTQKQGQSIRKPTFSQRGTS
ncbi:hypothetical protein DH2020_032906 [Rehmannia glutinosa]|uniref:Secreted protein n=1 Tax=Rehmannia glutinosa TaxID=99300 RepID=A0ABR0VG38_REHGL